MLQFAFTHSHTHSYRDVGAATLGANTSIRSNSGLINLPKDTQTSKLEELGIEPLIFRFVDDLLYLLRSVYVLPIL